MKQWNEWRKWMKNEAYENERNEKWRPIGRCIYESQFTNCLRHKKTIKYMFISRVVWINENV